ncbi:phospholipase A1-like [Neocloeon triangulifer]|uniref:phospholipase A1-like n=1 Tax=Neocloeon triangulifer TaxID=2078957 RepID=UPI00286F25AA|nr:phospholipase A1-like [Neocloeon triangulifer]
MWAIGRVCIVLAAATAICSGRKFTYQNVVYKDKNEFIAAIAMSQGANVTTTGNVTGTFFFCTTLSDSATCPNSLVQFYLYTSVDRERALIDTTDANWFSKNNFDITKKTVLLIHGFATSDQIGSTPILKAAYLKTGEYNVISADFEILMQYPCYSEAIYNLKVLGKCTAHMLAFLERSTGVKYVDVTCVGHSLGAHVCGITTNYLATKLKKIIGLDPARPFVQGRIASLRLDASDATQVQVIHTNAGFYGFSGFQGTVDFCPNGGYLQTTCRYSYDRNACSHSQSVCIMAESLFVSKRRTAIPCEKTCPYTRLRVVSGSNATVGISVSSTASGMYCLNVPTAPYCNSADPNYGDSRCCG